MNHLIVAPVVLPLLVAAAQLVLARRLPAQRALGAAALLALAAIAALLVGAAASGERGVYALGAWPAPFGIVLVLDRAAALLVAVTTAIAAAAFAAAARGIDARGMHFHPIFQFQLAGLNGAFLTGDLFNLFVFFEVLLIASYCLLTHGLGVPRLRAGLHYVVINLAASALFLIAVGTLYGVTGTLNMADLGVRIAALAEPDAALARAAGLLLLVVFAVKAAAFPLHFWLPSAYTAAAAPVAALFAVMTKVGGYAVLRIYPLAFGAPGDEAGLIGAPLLALGLASVVAGTIGALAAPRLAVMVAYFTVVSAGTILVAIALSAQAGAAAALYYMAHSSFALAALFLLADVLAARRGAAGDRLAPGPVLARPAALALLLLAGAVSIAGLPPSSGFIGKLLVLQAARGEAVAWVWSVVLGASLLAIVCLTRAGSALLWSRDAAARPGASAGASELAPAAFLVVCGVAMAAFAAPIHRYTDAAAAQLLDRQGYAAAVLGEGAAR